MNKIINKCIINKKLVYMTQRIDWNLESLAIKNINQKKGC